MAESFEYYFGDSERSYLQGRAELRRAGSRRYSLDAVHSLVFKINSFMPRKVSGEIDTEALLLHQQEEILGLPKFQYIKYLQVNGRSPSKVSINVSYPGQAKVKWVPLTPDMPRGIQSDLEEAQRYGHLMVRDVPQEERDFLILSQIRTNRLPKTEEESKDSIPDKI